MNYVKSFDLFGVEAQQIPCMTGKGAPTTSTEGAVGCLYMDSSNGKMYKCTNTENGTYTWVDDAYTKAEIDQMVSGVYRFCGSTTVITNMQLIAATPTRVGDVYHIATGGEITQGADMSIPIRGVDSMSGTNYMYIPRTEYDNILAMAAEGGTNSYITIGEEGSSYSNAKAVITNIKIHYMDESSIEMSFDFQGGSSITDISEIDTAWKITYMDYNLTLEAGDNVAWTGQLWDKL